MLQKFIIHNLFGLFDYNFEFNGINGENIRFITGPNGYGKTTILNLIQAVLSQDWDYLTDTQYLSLECWFNDGRVSIDRNKIETTDPNIDISTSETIKLQAKYYNKDGRLRSEFNRLHVDNSNEDAYLGDFKGEMSIFLRNHNESLFYIRDNRIYANNDTMAQSKSMNRTININNDNLISRMNKFADEIREIFQLSNVSSNVYTTEQYQEDERLLKPFTYKLNAYELTDIEWPEYDSDEPLRTMRVVDSFRKVYKKMFEFVERLDLFTSLIASCRFVNKRLALNRQLGYFFIFENDGTPLPELGNLSSGEQHIMIQFYEMLFNTEIGGLVLIDEPEMSFHLAWQIHYMENIRKICNYRKLQCIVATHSTQIFERKWDMVSDLYRLTHPEILKK